MGLKFVVAFGKLVYHPNSLLVCDGTMLIWKVVHIKRLRLIFEEIDTKVTFYFSINCWIFNFLLTAYFAENITPTSCFPLPLTLFVIDYYKSDKKLTLKNSVDMVAHADFFVDTTSEVSNGPLRSTH